VKIDPLKIIPVDLHKSYHILVVDQMSRRANTSRDLFVQKFIELGASSFFTLNHKKMTGDGFIRKDTAILR
jgi:hypothetical protein